MLSAACFKSDPGHHWRCTMNKTSPMSKHNVALPVECACACQTGLFRIFPLSFNTLCGFYADRCCNTIEMFLRNIYIHYWWKDVQHRSLQKSILWSASCIIKCIRQFALYWELAVRCSMKFTYCFVKFLPYTACVLYIREL